MTMIGIDPHKATHTAVAIDDNEVVLDEFKLRASSVQAQRLQQWAEGFEKRQWAVESANGLGPPRRSRASGVPKSAELEMLDWSQRPGADCPR